MTDSAKPQLGRSRSLNLLTFDHDFNRINGPCEPQRKTIPEVQTNTIKFFSFFYSPLAINIYIYIYYL